MTNKTKIASGIAILCGFGAWAAYTLYANQRLADKEIRETLRPIEYSASAAIVGERYFSDSFEYRGTTAAGKMINLFSETDGKIIYCAIRTGAFVSRGLLLVQIDSATRQSNYQISRDSYDKALNDYTKLKGLEDSGNASRQEVAGARLLMQNAASQLQISKKQLGQTSVTAPEEGFIVGKKINAGEYVQAGSLLATIASLHEVLATVYVPENKIARIQTGNRVRVKADAWPGMIFTGIVSAVIPVASEAHSFPVQITIVNDQKGKPLMAGMNVSVVFDDGKPSKALVIPRTSLVAENQHPAVYLVHRQAGPPGLLKPVLTQVTIGQEYGSFLEVLGGLYPGDTIMTSGQSNAEPGALLRHILLTR